MWSPQEVASDTENIFFPQRVASHVPPRVQQLPFLSKYSPMVLVLGDKRVKSVTLESDFGFAVSLQLEGPKNDDIRK